MRMCYDGALVLPSSFKSLSENELIEILGGDKWLPISRSYLDKSRCYTIAGAMLRRGEVTGMTQTEIAQEIYAHAYSYYCHALMVCRVGIVIANYCYQHAADGITIENGGDSAVRKAAYATLWNW